MDLRIVGMSDQREAFVVSKERSFRLNEFLIIQDQQGELLGEISESYSYNELNGLPQDNQYLSLEVLEEMKKWDYDLAETTVYIGKISLIEEARYPIETGSAVRIPLFDEIKAYFIGQPSDHDLVLAALRNTDDIYQTIGDQDQATLTGLFHTLEGAGLLDQRDLPYIMNLQNQAQYPHIGIFGSSGSGKSYGLRVFIEELIRKKIPGLVFDPHNEMDFGQASPANPGIDYQTSCSYLQVGQDLGVDFTSLNRGDLKVLLGAISPLTESMDHVVDVLLERRDSAYTFEQKIRDMQKIFNLGGMKRAQELMQNDPKQVELLNMALATFEKYSDMVNPSSLNGVAWRFFQLSQLGLFQSNLQVLEDQLGQRKMCIVRGDLKLLKVYSTYLLDNIYKKRKNYRDRASTGRASDYFPPFMIITDESHQFAPQNPEERAPSRAVLREIAQEGRKYGVFLVLATQRPTLLDATTMAQLNTKMIFRTGRETDIHTIREETDLSSAQAKRLPYLPSGDVFISEAGKGRTIYARIRAAHTDTPHKENPFVELEEVMSSQDQEIFDKIASILPINEASLASNCQALASKYGLTLSAQELLTYLEKYVEEGKIQVGGLALKTYKKIGT